MEDELKYEEEGKKRVVKEWGGEKISSKIKSKKKDIKSLLKQKLNSKKIISKGKKPTVVINIPHQGRREIKSIMKDSIEEDRRNFFFR